MVTFASDERFIKMRERDRKIDAAVMEGFMAVSCNRGAAIELMKKFLVTSKDDKFLVCETIVYKIRIAGRGARGLGGGMR